MVPISGGVGKVKQEEMQPATAESMVSSECPVNSNPHSVSLFGHLRWDFFTLDQRGLLLHHTRSFHSFSKKASESKAPMPDVSTGHRAQKLIPC